MNKKKRIIFIVLFFSRTIIGVYAQNQISLSNSYNPIPQRSLNDSEIYHGPQIGKKIGHYSTDDWQAVINTYWGEGLPTSEKLEIFDLAIDKIDRQYAAFQNLEINLDSLKNYYRPEIEKGVSRGRFAAIMNYISLALREAHTIVADIPVNFGTALGPGVPLFVISPWQGNNWFGAALTPLPDSSLLVYRTLSNHKLGLTAGDIVLGYDGIPWKELYKELLEAELPICIMGAWGSTQKSLTHAILGSAGLNWHLFDTIDIVKHPTNDTLHLSTSPLRLQSGFIWGNEQLPVSGVPFPNFSTNNFVYWGIIPGTKIGYIYVTSWSPNAEYNISTQFYNAINSLMNENDTEGLILDFRSNNGGYMGVAHAGYSLLFNEKIYSVAFDRRAAGYDHFSMIPYNGYLKEQFLIPGNPSTFYDKPIAVLTGPGSISNGDFESWRMKLHPKARLFGKSSCGAYATSIYPDLNNEDWFFYLTYGNSYPVDSPGEYLVHTNLEIDEEVWLTQEGVINGSDDVVAKAIEWINSPTSVEDEKQVNMGYELEQNYPNPFNPTTTIKFTIPNERTNRNQSLHAKLIVYNLLGQQIINLVDKQKSPGIYEVFFNAEELAGGVYFARLIIDGESRSTIKMLLLK